MEADAFHSIKYLNDPLPLWKGLKWVGLPYSLRWSLIRQIRLLYTPRERAARRKMIGPAPKGKSAEILAELEKSGLTKFDDEFAPDSKRIADRLSPMFAAERTKGSSKMQAGSKKAEFLVTLLRDADFISYPEVLTFILDEKFLTLAAHYLGEVPVLSAISLWWSPVNSSAESSQLYHFDEVDDRQVKFFLNVEAVREENGPFTAVPAEVSKRARERSGGTLSGRRSDELVASCLNEAEPVKFVGEKGALAAVDTSRCLHYGSRGNTADRAVLMFQFTRFSAPLGSLPQWGEAIRPFARTLSPRQRRALQLT